jgi:hypothetical protein
MTSALDIRCDALLHLFPENRCAPPQLAPQDVVSPGSAGQSSGRPPSVPPLAATGKVRHDRRAKQMAHRLTSLMVPVKLVSRGSKTG